jgi:4-hydroxybenzoate polyprenyltransferase
MGSIGKYLSLVRFSHSIFALPFALQGAWLAARGVPAPRSLLLIVFCAVAARTAAMAFNRLIDRKIDASNPRTVGREIPAGLVSPLAATVLVLASSGLFILGAWALGPLCFKLSPLVLLVLLGYSTFKRFSALAHFALGLALALAPLGAWLAIRGDLDGDLRPVLLLSFGVLTWVAGFDLIYACQDAEYDADVGLHSIPAKLGVARALTLSSLLHVLAVLAFFGEGWLAGLGWPYWVAFAVATTLMIWEHRIVSPGDLSRVNAAFFTLNGWVGVGLFLGVALDLALS